MNFMRLINMASSTDRFATEASNSLIHVLYTMFDLSHDTNALAEEPRMETLPPCASATKIITERKISSDEKCDRFSICYT
jgi:hypothetical protein